MTDAEKVRKVREIVRDYLNGPNGEAHLADAHDFLLDIRDVVEPPPKRKTP